MGASTCFGPFSACPPRLPPLSGLSACFSPLAPFSGDLPLPSRLPASLAASASDIEHLSVRLEEAHTLAVGQCLHPDAVGALGSRVPDRDLRCRQRHLLLDDAALAARLGVGLGVLLRHIHALDYHAPVAEHLDDGATPALVAAREHDDLVALTDLPHVSFHGLRPACHGLRPTVLPVRFANRLHIAGALRADAKSLFTVLPGPTR